MQFIRENIKPGYQLLAHTDTVFGWMIRKVLGSDSTHDALICAVGRELQCAEFHSPVQTLMVGDAQPPVATLHPLSYYEGKINAGKWRIKVIRPVRWSDKYGDVASEEWLLRVHNSPYDYWAFWRSLVWRCMFKWWPAIQGKDWAWYCTEGVRKASMAATEIAFSEVIDFWKNQMPTPRTTEKRLAEGVFVDVTSECVEG